MDNFQIETAQNVNIAQNVAGIGDRILAYLLDSLIMIAYVIVVSFVFAAIGSGDDLYFVMIMTMTLPLFLYHFLWEILWNGRSPGKAVMKLRVVKIDGSKPALSNYLLRWLLRIIDFTLSSGAVAFIVILFNGKGQRLGDLAARTTVITEKKVISFEDTLLTELPVNYQPVYPQVTVFTDNEIQTIKSVFQDAKMNGNHNVILKLSERISKVMEITPAERPMQFIDTVLKDYNFYTQQM